jgi:hypothetical protein
MPDAQLSPITPLRAQRRSLQRRGPEPIRRNAGVVEQVRIACSRQHRLATFVGALLGAVVPFSTYMIAHNEMPEADWTGRFALCVALVAGGLLYSARTVFQWGELALTSRAKALGFTVLLEGVMTCSQQDWLSVTALVYLCAINAIATGVTLARGTPAPRGAP